MFPNVIKSKWFPMVTTGILLIGLPGCRWIPVQSVSDSSVSLNTRTESDVKHIVGVQTVSFDEPLESSGTGQTKSLPETEDSGIELDNEPVAGSVEWFEELALAVNPTIQKAESELCALQGRLVQVGLTPNPTAGIFGDDINDAGNAGRYGVYYSQRVVRGNRLCLDRQKVLAQIEAKQVEIAELQQRLITDVRLRFYDVLVSEAKVDVAKKLYETSSNVVQATKQLVQVKEIASTSLIQSELEFAKARLHTQRVDNELAAARRQLAGLINEDVLPTKKLTGTLAPGPEMTELEDRFSTLLSESPEIARMFAEFNVAKRHLRHQRALSIPDMTWQAGLAFDFASDEVVPNFQIGLPINKYDWNQGNIAEARHRVVASERAVAQKALAIRQRLVDAYRQYQDAKLQVDALASGIRPKAKEALERISFGYEKGEVGFLELLNAQRTFFQINLEYVQQLQILWQQKIRIEGMMLQDNLIQTSS